MIFKQIEGWEFYEVSDTGVVRSLPRKVVKSDGVIQNRKECELKPRYTSDGYGQVILCHDKNRKQISVHRLVALTFIPNPDNLREVNHIDGNKDNNHVSNLEWVTHKQNMRHAIDSSLWQNTISERDSLGRIVSNRNRRTN